MVLNSSSVNNPHVPARGKLGFSNDPDDEVMIVYPIFLSLIASEK